MFWSFSDVYIPYDCTTVHIVFIGALHKCAGPLNEKAGVSEERVTKKRCSLVQQKQQFLAIWVFRVQGLFCSLVWLTLVFVY